MYSPYGNAQSPFSVWQQFQRPRAFMPQLPVRQALQPMPPASAPVAPAPQGLNQPSILRGSEVQPFGAALPSNTSMAPGVSAPFAPVASGNVSNPFPSQASSRWSPFGGKYGPYPLATLGHTPDLPDPAQAAPVGVPQQAPGPSQVSMPMSGAPQNTPPWWQMLPQTVQTPQLAQGMPQLLSWNLGNSSPNQSAPVAGQPVGAMPAADPAAARGATPRQPFARGGLACKCGA